MKKGSLVLLVVGICIAWFLIFKLIFKEVTGLMMWNVATAIVMTALTSLNFQTVKSTLNLTVKHAAGLLGMNAFAVGSFGWTLFFTFCLGNFWTGNPKFDVLYIGYLVLLIVCGVLWYTGFQGAYIAETIHEEENRKIDLKNRIIAAVSGLHGQLDSSSELYRKVTDCVIRMRSVPYNKFEDERLQGAAAKLIESFDVKGRPNVDLAIDELKRCIELMKA
jgi:hypothetical protein